ncbi:hypothetical protein C8J56DRAFT_783365 [Mycena floridula]|nr:hypothetical protein C8J56DRAFT_783365 [Mycena floridula]
MLNPIRRMPNEILCEIFLSFINENLEEGHAMNSLNISASHWAVTHVCREWRRTAVSFPRMWSTVRIAEEDLDGTTGDVVTLHVLGTQLQRSGTHELSVSIACEDFIPSHPVLQSLLCTSHRWKDFCIMIPLSNFYGFEVLRASLPSLRTLHIWDTSVEDSNLPDEDATSVFEFASNLRTLFGHPHALSSFKLPFTQITTLESVFDSPCHSYLKILALLPNLEKLTTSCIDPGDIDHHAKIVQLARLRHAILNRGDEEEPHGNSDCVLLCRLSLPALQELDVTIYESMDEFRALLERSQYPLVKLSLRVHDLDNEEDDECIEFLEDLPSLTTFKLSCSDDFATKIIETLIQNPSIIPGLWSLEIDSDLDLEQIEDLNEARPLLSLTRWCASES